jgi:hypothetical protein
VGWGAGGRVAVAVGVGVGADGVAVAVCGGVGVPEGVPAVSDEAALGLGTAGARSLALPPDPTRKATSSMAARPWRSKNATQSRTVDR